MELFSSSYRFFSPPCPQLYMQSPIKLLSLSLWMKEDIHCQKSEEIFTIFKAYFKKWNTMRLRTWPVEDNRLKNKWPQVHLRMTSVWLCSKLLFEVRKEQIPFCLGTKLGACSLLSIYCGSVMVGECTKEWPPFERMDKLFC